jgi:hypothetical protein
MILAIMLGLGAGTQQSATAGSVLHFTFSGTVTFGAGTLPVHAGDPIQGTFSYDTGAAAISITPTLAMYATGDFHYTVGNNEFSYTSHPATTETAVLFHEFGLNTGLVIQDTHLSVQTAIQLNNPLDVLSSTALPNPLPPSSAFESKLVTYFDPNGDQFSATIDQFRAVPEPSTLCLGAISTFAMLASRSWMRRRASA